MNIPQNPMPIVRGAIGVFAWRLGTTAGDRLWCPYRAINRVLGGIDGLKRVLGRCHEVLSGGDDVGRRMVKAQIPPILPRLSFIDHSSNPCFIARIQSRRPNTQTCGRRVATLEGPGASGGWCFVRALGGSGFAGRRCPAESRSPGQDDASFGSLEADLKTWSFACTGGYAEKFQSGSLDAGLSKT